MGDHQKMKKLGKLKIKKHTSNQHVNCRIHGETVLEKPVWGDIYQMEGSQKTWGIIKTTLPEHQYQKIEDAFDQLNEEHELNLKIKEKKDYYDNPVVKIYHTAPTKQLTEQLIDILGKLYWKGETHSINFKRNNTDWKTVKKHETAKAL